MNRKQIVPSLLSALLLSSAPALATTLSCQDVPGGRLSYSFSESNGGALWQNEHLTLDNIVFINHETWQGPYSGPEVKRAYFQLTGKEEVPKQNANLVIFLSDAEISKVDRNDKDPRLEQKLPVLCERTIYQGPVGIP